MYEGSACYDPNSGQEGLADDSFSQTNIPNNYHHHQITSAAAAAFSAMGRGGEEAAAFDAAVGAELQQQLSIEMNVDPNNHHNILLSCEQQQQQPPPPPPGINWVEEEININYNNNNNTNYHHDPSSDHLLGNNHHLHPHDHPMSFINSEGTNNSSTHLMPPNMPNYPTAQTPDLLNLFHLPRCPANTSISFANSSLEEPPPTAGTNHHLVMYDPLLSLPLNLPPQPPFFRELLQSLPNGHGYNMMTGTSSTLFGDHDHHHHHHQVVDHLEREVMSNIQDQGGYDGGDGFFEFGSGRDHIITGIGRGREGKGTKHFATEKNRRENMNGRFKALKDLVPNPTKSDRASVVGDAIEYINELKRTVDELKILVERKRCSRGSRMMKRRRLTAELLEDQSTLDVESINTRPTGEVGDQLEQANYNYNGPSSSSSSALRSSWLQRKSKNTEVDVRIIDDEVTIKLVQQKKINCLLFVSRVLDELRLDLHHVAGGLIGDFYSFLFNTKIYQGSFVYASAIANKLIDVVDRQYEYAANTPAGNNILLAST